MSLPPSLLPRLRNGLSQSQSRVFTFLHFVWLKYNNLGPTRFGLVSLVPTGFGSYLLLQAIVIWPLKNCEFQASVLLRFPYFAFAESQNLRMKAWRVQVIPSHRPHEVLGQTPETAGTTVLTQKHPKGSLCGCWDNIGWVKELSK